MAACAFDDVEQEFTSSGSRRSSGFSGNPGKTRGLQALELQPGDSEATRKDPVKEGLIKVLPAQEHPAAGDGRKERMGCDRPGPEESRTRRIPAMSTEAGDGAEEEQRVGEKGWLRGVRGSRHDKRPSGDEASSSSSSSSSQRGPPTRRGSEDSTLMEAESTASSGRSTPAMITGTRAGSTPTIDPASSSKGSAYPCCWDRCLDSFSSSPDLAEHVRGVHADSQRGGMYVCLWRGCKVYNTPSSNPSWLQRHLLSHSGDKPFKCVVAGCSASFASQGGVARHVASHFSQQNASKPANQHRGKEESPSKGSVRRRRLRSRHRRFLPRPHDFFDAQTMDAIRHRAICLNLATHIESLGHGHSVVFHSTVIARRKEDSGKVKVLLHWTPEDILPDAWVCETDRPQLKTKIVHLSQLPRDTALLLDPKTYRMFL